MGAGSELDSMIPRPTVIASEIAVKRWRADRIVFPFGGRELSIDYYNMSSSDCPRHILLSGQGEAVLKEMDGVGRVSAVATKYNVPKNQTTS